MRTYTDPYDRMFFFILFLYKIDAITWSTCEPFLEPNMVDPLRGYNARILGNL